VHAEHLLEFLPKMSRDQVERLLEHRAAFDCVDGLQRLQPALQLLREGALAGSDRAHEVEHLAALLTLQRGGMKVADDLADRLLDAEELVLEEVVDLDGLVLVEPLHARLVGLENVARTVAHHHLVDARVGELRERRVLANQFEVFEESAPPPLRVACRSILFDQLLERGLAIHERCSSRLAYVDRLGTVSPGPSTFTDVCKLGVCLR
jgi:hypothetical protein